MVEECEDDLYAFLRYASWKSHHPRTLINVVTVFLTRRCITQRLGAIVSLFRLRHYYIRLGKDEWFHLEKSRLHSSDVMVWPTFAWMLWRLRSRDQYLSYLSIKNIYPLGNEPAGGVTTVSKLAGSDAQRCAPQGSCPASSILWVTCCIITFGPAHDSR